ncbi:MAG TPA: hypothetical protein VNM14_08790, partial [Planctomycetota bacterium]|nr:hypothetical protein [Planctomycetota bacterium]
QEYDEQFDYLRSMESLAPPSRALETPRPEAELSHELVSRCFRSWAPELYKTEARWRSEVQTVRLAVALALYELEWGRPALRLADLVPHYVPFVPETLLDGARLGYRPGELVVIQRGDREDVWAVGRELPDD